MKKKMCIRDSLTALQSGQADLSRYLPQWSIKDLKACLLYTSRCV